MSKNLCTMEEGWLDSLRLAKRDGSWFLVLVFRRRGGPGLFEVHCMFHDTDAYHDGYKWSEVRRIVNRISTLLNTQQLVSIRYEVIGCRCKLHICYDGGNIKLNEDYWIV